MRKMKKDYWDSSENSSHLDKEKFVKMLTDSGADVDIAHEVVNQISMVDEDNSNIIFIFTDDNQLVVTGIHVPAESLNGQIGPVLMRGGNEKSIIAAFSRDFIAEKLEKVNFVEENPGLPEAGDSMWVEELERLAEMVRLEIRTNPPENWDELLAGE